MKVTLNWLKQYVDFTWSPGELAERLTLLGLEVEGIHKIAADFEGIVVAQVITRDRHPNADKLSLCRVNDGAGERQIVCGADNFQAGDKVPLIFPGATLPAKSGEKPLTIKVGKIRGVESHGMLCSPQELGLAVDSEGLLILPPDAKVGQPFAEHLGRASGDVVYDLETTPNRPDWNSVVGIAREISALTGNALKLPRIEMQPAAGAEPIAQLVGVRIDDAELCPRYTARVVRGVKVGPSPDWLRGALEKIGLRSINNVVDVTNYVMLEIGQPLHAFDYHLLGKSGPDPRPAIVVRRASEGEKFVTLDGQERTLTGDMLLIADEQNAIALAGIMGGQNTEINESTVDVLIESACFNPRNIRRTSRRLELRTDSSYRFERGADVGICDWASRRAAQLILETAGGTLAEGVLDAYPQPAEMKQITLRPEKVTQLLGIEIPVGTQIEMLQRLGLERQASGKERPVAPGANAMSNPVGFRIPTFRVDLKREVDLIEEITRLYGVDKIPATTPRSAIGSNPADAMHDQFAEARRLLAGLGLNEAQGQTLVSDDVAKLVTNAGQPQIATLANPLSSDMNVLRPSLLPGLLDSLRHNLRHKNHDVALFELGRVFSQAAEADAGREALPCSTPREEWRMAIALTGRRHPDFWSGADRDVKFDIYDLKGALEEFFEQFGVRGLAYARRAESTGLFIESAAIQLGRQTIGELGQLLPPLARRYDLRDAVFLAELNLDLLLARRGTARSFKSLPQFPAIRRDVAMLVPEPTTHEAVLSTVRQAKPQNLERVELFDVFRGKNVPAGRKSMAYAFTYRNPERTLTDAEVNTAHGKLVEQLRNNLQAAIREG